MFMDDVNNRYTYLNTLKNIVWEEPADRTPSPEISVTVHHDMLPVLQRLIKERPTWRYKCTQRFVGSGVYRASNFHIFDGDENLGVVYMEHHWRDGTPRFYFDNYRLAKERVKNQKNFSTKPDVAAKRILKAFHLKTPKERAAEAVSTIRASVQDVANAADWPLRRAKTVLERMLVDYAARHWDTMREALGGDATSIDLPGLIEAKRDADGLIAAMSDTKGVTVRLEANGSYMVTRPMNDTYHVEFFTDATLSDHLRGALGLLKMLEVGGFVAGIGVRGKDNTYYVMDRKEEPSV